MKTKSYYLKERHFIPDKKEITILRGTYVNNDESIYPFYYKRRIDLENFEHKRKFVYQYNLLGSTKLRYISLTFKEYLRFLTIQTALDIPEFLKGIYAFIFRIVKGK